MQITWDNVRPLIVDEHTAGDTLHVLFRCPASRAEVPASADRPPTPEPAPDAPFASLGDDAGAVLGARSPDRWTAAQRKLAAVDAFRSVASWFVWDPRHHRWIATDAASGTLTDLQRQVAKAPLTQAWDREVGARILAEVALADPPLSEAEHAVLTEAMPDRVPGIDALIGTPALTDAELGEVSAGEVRVTCIMLGWVMVYGNGTESANQAAALQRFATRLGLGDADAARARDAARSHLFEAALDSLYAGPGFDQAARDAAYRFADAIGMARADAEAAEARFLKRAAAEAPPTVRPRHHRRGHIPPEVSRRSELWGVGAVLAALLFVIGVWWLRPAPTPTPAPAPEPAPGDCTNKGKRVDFTDLGGPTGLVVDQQTGEVAWKHARSQGAAFAYVRATSGATADTGFAEAWSRAAGCGIPRGAVHDYVPGVAVEDQVAAFTAALAKGAGELPPALDLQQGYVDGAATCTVMVAEIAEMALLLRKDLGEAPVIRVGTEFWSGTLSCAGELPISVAADTLAANGLWVVAGSDPAAFEPWSAWVLFGPSDSPGLARFNGDEAALKAWK